MDNSVIEVKADLSGVIALTIGCERSTAHTRKDNRWCGYCCALRPPEDSWRMHVSASKFTLTPREVEVLALVATGRDNKRIGRVLAVSQHTVASHLKAIFTKTGTTNRTEAAVLALRERLCS